ncbi:MAG TPA: hypothetical protein VJ954_02985 [Ignavibacteriaceae bacterium]|nr:hypothetical protein [Ignavibacteriaceae bacterium]
MEQSHKISSANDLTSITKDFSGLKKLEYFRPNVVRLDLSFILTENKLLVLNMPYLKLEGQHVDAVRLLDIWDKDGYVFLKIENITTGIINTISWLVEYDGDYWLWSLASFNYLKTLTKTKKIDS